MLYIPYYALHETHSNWLWKMWQTCDKSNKKYEEKKKIVNVILGWCYKHIHIYISLYLYVYTPPNDYQQHVQNAINIILFYMYLYDGRTQTMPQFS